MVRWWQRYNGFLLHRVFGGVWLASDTQSHLCGPGTPHDGSSGDFKLRRPVVLDGMVQPCIGDNYNVHR
jgi:hypothetical protein